MRPLKEHKNWHPYGYGFERNQIINYGCIGIALYRKLMSEALPLEIAKERVHSIKKTLREFEYDDVDRVGRFVD